MFRLMIVLFALIQSIVFATNAISGPLDGINDLDGVWIYVEDRTEGRELERLGPPMSSTFSLKVQEGAIVLNGHGSGHRDVRVALDGSITEVAEKDRIVRYSGSWSAKTFEYKVTFERKTATNPNSISMIQRKFQITEDGLLVTVKVEPMRSSESVGLYRHAEDIAMPPMAKAEISDLEWISGAWIGKRSTGSSVEERWSPPLGGAMLAISRSVNVSGKMFAFEYLRIVEREGGLVYIAQPGGGTPTEFVLTEWTKNRAVFDNPRHDYPKRIVYERTPEGSLTATIGYAKGGTPRRFDFTREMEKP